MPMDVDGACLSGPKGKVKMKDKGKGKTDDPKGKGKETGVCHGCNMLGHLRKDCSVYKKRIAESVSKGKGRDSCSSRHLSKGLGVCRQEHCIRFGDEETVIAAVHRSEKRYAPAVTAKGTAPPLFSIDGSSIEQRGVQESALGETRFRWRDEENWFHDG